MSSACLPYIAPYVDPYVGLPAKYDQNCRRLLTNMIKLGEVIGQHYSTRTLDPRSVTPLLRERVSTITMEFFSVCENIDIPSYDQLVDGSDQVHDHDHMILIKVMINRIVARCHHPSPDHLIWQLVTPNNIARTIGHLATRLQYESELLRGCISDEIATI
jgi:hypothetical protein